MVGDWTLCLCDFLVMGATDELLTGRAPSVLCFRKTCMEDENT